MADLGFPELILILIIALLLFGADKVPQIARSLGKAIQEFKKGMQEPSDEHGEKGEKEESNKK